MESLLNNTSTNVVPSVINEGSLLGGTEVSDGAIMSSVTETATETVTNANNVPAMSVEQRREILKNPEYQAAIVFENYIRSSNRVFSGQEKRRIRREILANAKRGKYRKMFSEETMASNFNSLNG